MENTTNTSALKEQEKTSFDEFMKMDIRVATILRAEVVPKPTNYWNWETGYRAWQTKHGGEHLLLRPLQTRKILSEKQVCLLANLAPRKIKGIESQGMILMAENTKGELCFVSPVDAGFQNGAIVK